MRQRISRYLGSVGMAAVAVVAPLAVSSWTAPATSTAQCPPGQTGVIYGCAPFCVEGKFLDTQTGLCTPIAGPPPVPAAPRPAPRF